MPPEQVPSELPEPCLGINFALDGMKRRDWLAMIAVHSDCWLMAVTSFNCARFSREARKSVFDRINDLPTIYDVIAREWNEDKKRKASGNANKSSQAAKEDDGSTDRCPISDRVYEDGEFWICCDRCDRWFYGKAVNMDEKRADKQKIWSCPFCKRPKLFAKVSMGAAT